MSEETFENEAAAAEGAPGAGEAVAAESALGAGRLPLPKGPLRPKARRPPQPSRPPCPLRWCWPAEARGAIGC